MTLTSLDRVDLRRENKPDWCSRISRDHNGNVRNTVANATLILTYDSAWAGVLGYDERSEEPVFRRSPPFLDCPAALKRAPRSLVDSDDVRVAQWLEEQYLLTLPLSQVHAALNAVAEMAPFDLVRDYLDRLTWDGAPRLDDWLAKYLGADSTAYTMAVGRRFLISGVARTYEPGCKADHVLVLEGPQGLGKSTALRVLAGNDFFGDDIPPIGSKDTQQYLGPLWLVELAEMDAASKAETATLKRFITTTMDRYRPPYGRRPIKHGRRCVFAGTVNHGEYLKDVTGGRRFWPVLCRAVNTKGLEAARDQLWAEAVHCYRAGEPWHLDAATEELARAEQAQRLEVDPWLERVGAYLAHVGDFVTSDEVLTKGLEVPPSRMNKTDSNRLGPLMRACGWKYSEGPNRRRGWRRP